MSGWNTRRNSGRSLSGAAISSGVEERERHLVARAVDDDVGLDLAAVGEARRGAGRAARCSASARSRRGRARQDVVGDRRVRLAARRARASAARSAPCRRRRPCSSAAEERLAHACNGTPACVRDLVERPAEQVLRDHPRAAARGEVDLAAAEKLASTAMSIALLPMPTTTTRLPRKKLGSSPDVVVRVHLPPGEPRAGERRLRPARVPVVAVGDDQRVVAPRLAAVERRPPRCRPPRRAACSTPVSNAIRSRKPKWST